MARAREFCQRAIALDPQYALAHTLYADYLFGRTTVWMSPMREVNPLIRAAALRALELDPDLRDAGALVRNGDREGGREVLRSLGSPESYGVSIGWALFHTPAANSMPPPSGSRVR